MYDTHNIDKIDKKNIRDDEFIKMCEQNMSDITNRYLADDKNLYP